MSKPIEFAVGDPVFRYEVNRNFCDIQSTVESLFRLDTYRISVITPQGYWVETRYKQKYKWINPKGKKRFAYPTKEEAMNNFRHRKISFLQRAKYMLKIAQADFDLSQRNLAREQALELRIGANSRRI